MKTIYKILNPLTGEYTDADTLDECINVIAETALSLFMAQTYDAPYSVCNINDDGTEVWERPDGTRTISIEEKKKKIREIVGNSLTSIPVTSIETLP